MGGSTRSPARALTADFLPAYAPFGKVALVNVKMKNKFRTLDDLTQPDVRVIKNPGGTNEAFVLANLTRAKVSTHDKNSEIPGLIAEGRGDVMITENAEAKLYAKKDKRLHAAFLENPLTPVNYMGFLLPAMGKEQLFKTVMTDGVLPRKTFSMGHAQDKRYYVEARKIR